MCFAQRITHFLQHNKENVPTDCLPGCPRAQDDVSSLSRSPSPLLPDMLSSFLPFPSPGPTQNLLSPLHTPSVSSALPHLTALSSVSPIASSTVLSSMSVLPSSVLHSADRSSASLAPAHLAPSSVTPPAPSSYVSPSLRPSAFASTFPLASSTSSASSRALPHSNVSESPTVAHVPSSASNTHLPPAYEPSTPSTFDRLADVELLLRSSGTEELRNTFWRVRGNSVEVCSKGLIAFLIHSRHHNNPFTPALPFFSIHPQDVKLDDIWTMHWSFKAYALHSFIYFICIESCYNSGTSTDSYGDGVMRQVLAHSIGTLCRSICSDPKTSSDHYAHLHPIQFGEDSLDDQAFALGVLSAMSLIRAHAAPLPISPILLQFMFGGIASLDDELWLRSMCPDTAHALSLFPRSSYLAQDFSHLSNADRELLMGLLHHVDKNNVRHGIVVMLVVLRLIVWDSLRNYLVPGRVSGRKSHKRYLHPFSWAA